jgi:chromatin segregation and condensation protein Rec8/ScpA/Scc1 (kleisin family)
MMLVTSFLACLELARLGHLTLEQDDLFAEIYCQKALATSAAELVDTDSEFDAPPAEDPASET